MYLEFQYVVILKQENDVLLHFYQEIKLLNKKKNLIIELILNNII
jgi:hypothetical protein